MVKILLAKGDLLKNTENSTQDSVIIYVGGKKNQREWICVYDRITTL